MGIFSGAGAGLLASEANAKAQRDDIDANIAQRERARAESEALHKLRSEQEQRAVYRQKQGTYQPTFQSDIPEATDAGAYTPTPQAFDPAARTKRQTGDAGKTPLPKDLSIEISEASKRLQAKNRADPQAQKDRRAVLAPVAAYGDMLTLPWNAAKNLTEGVKAVGKDVINRGANMVLGRDAYNTDNKGNYVSLTPYTDEYIRKPEQGMTNDAATLRRLQQEDAARITAQNTPAPAAPAAGGKSQYDIATPYDGLIQQAAQQHGVDPVILKRLLGSESSFNPTVVNPQAVGGDHAVGIAQILPNMHGVTPQQAADPKFAIPFAAKLLAQKLQESGGDYQQAIYGYKGAKTAAGRASVSKAMADIFPGGAPAAGQAAPAPSQPTATAPAAPQYTIPQIAPVDDQKFAFAQSQLARIDSLMQATRDTGQLANLQSARDTLVGQLQGMAVDRAFYNAQAGDVRSLGGLASYLKVPVGKLADGRFVVNVGGQQQVLTQQELLNGLYSRYVELQRGAQFAELDRKHSQTMQLEQLKSLNAAQLEQLKADLSASGKISEEMAKGMIQAGQAKFSHSDPITGNVYVTFGNGRVVVVEKVSDKHGDRYVSTPAQPS